MTKDKDFKRLVRARMKKTGESYTTARAHLLDKRAHLLDEQDPLPEDGTSTGQAASAPDDYANVAGMSDEAVEAKTGCDWRGWVESLDEAGASAWSHRDIAAHVAETYDVSGWWAQTLTVGYERIKGLRDVGQRRDGSYEANKSKTIPVPIERLYRAFEDDDERRRWLGEVDLEVRTATPAKSMRITWEDGTAVDVYFTAKGDAKSRVALQHRKLESEEAREEMKTFWAERFERLAELASL